MIDSSTIGTARADIAALLSEDSLAAERATLRRFYFDDVAPGESTKKFHDALRAGEPPVVGIVRDGRLLLDVRAIGDDEVDVVAAAVAAARAARSL